MRLIFVLCTNPQDREAAMAFRADEAARTGFDRAAAYLVPKPREVDDAERSRSREALLHLVDELGPAIDAFPSWHPLVRNHNPEHPVTTPNDRCGYKGLDHTIYFANGFITCPYGDGQAVIDSVDALPGHPIAHISADKLDVIFYSPHAVPVLVKCNWGRPLAKDGTIPPSIAVRLILENEIPCCEWSHFAETWESMRDYLLGSPHGSRSSLFVNQETGQTIKKVWNLLINTGMFGPVKVG